MDNEKKELDTSTPLPLDGKDCVPLHRAGAGQTEGAASAAAPLLFRGKPIAWVDVPKTKSVIVPNAIGEDGTEERITGKQHLISYGGKRYQREEFLTAMFPDYKKFPYRVKFKNEDVFRLNAKQRAKLQYNVLAHKFGLVPVALQDRVDLERLCE